MRCFEDEEVTHVEGEVDPLRDLEIIHEELRLKDEEMIVKARDAVEKRLKHKATKEEKEEHAYLMTLTEWVIDNKRDVRHGTWNGKEIEYINTMQLITAKVINNCGHMYAHDCVCVCVCVCVLACGVSSEPERA